MQHKTEVFIEGKYDKGPGNSFALPTHKPLMILRDPPGGSSYAKYSNVVTTIKAVSDRFQLSSSGSASLDTSGSIGTELKSCTGPVAPGAATLVCTDISKTKNSQNVKVGTSLDTDLFNRDKKFSNSYSTTWSYTTNSEAARAGPESDVFVVPNLNVEYIEIYAVNWNSTKCKPELVLSSLSNEYEFPTTFDIDLSKLP